MSFYRRVSSEEDYDWLEFYIDDVRHDRISGSSTEGDDRGCVDYLQWTGDALIARRLTCL